MSLAGVMLGLINIAIVVAILLLIGAIAVWLAGYMEMAVPTQVRRGYIAVVALIALYLLVAMVLGIPSIRLISVSP